jgi:hypothetical protein
MNLDIDPAHTDPANNDPTDIDLDSRIQNLVATAGSIQSEIQHTLALFEDSKAADQRLLESIDSAIQCVEANGKSETIDSSIQHLLECKESSKSSMLRLLAHLRQTSTQQTPPEQTSTQQTPT